MGWNKLLDQRGELYEGIDEGAFAYFVHSFYAAPSDTSVVTAWCDYGIRFTAAVQQDNVFATQYHPEKSGDIGLKMLENFAKYGE